MDEHHDHQVEILRTQHEDPSIPAAFHGTCSCGWAMESHDEQQLRRLATAHEVSETHEIPAPASPSPITTP